MYYNLFGFINSDLRIRQVIISVHLTACEILCDRNSFLHKLSAFIVKLPEPLKKSTRWIRRVTFDEGNDQSYIQIGWRTRNLPWRGKLNKNVSSQKCWFITVRICKKTRLSIFLAWIATQYPEQTADVNAYATLSNNNCKALSLLRLICRAAATLKILVSKKKKKKWKKPTSTRKTNGRIESPIKMTKRNRPGDRGLGYRYRQHGPGSGQK